MYCICISGYFDPIHLGHLDFIRKAKKLACDRGGGQGELVVILNSDKQLALKKGRSFLPQQERLQMLQSLRYVDKVILAIDTDTTVCETLAQMDPKPDAFANGGERVIPEQAICDQLGIAVITNVGASIGMYCLKRAKLLNSATTVWRTSSLVKALA